MNLIERFEPKDGADGVHNVLQLVRWGRIVLTSACSLLLLAGLWTDNSTMITCALVIGLEELYETSMAITLLEKIEENERAWT